MIHNRADSDSAVNFTQGRKTGAYIDVKSLSLTQWRRWLLRLHLIFADMASTGAGVAQSIRLRSGRLPPHSHWR